VASEISGFTRRVGLSIALAGVDLRTTARAARRSLTYARDLVRFRTMSKRHGFPVPKFHEALPAMADATEQAGAIGSEYFHADLWTARRIFAAAPRDHLDVGSRVDGLVGHLLCFRNVDVVDLRDLDSAVAGLSFVQADATSLAGIADGAFESVSSIHAIEHFGLGRYGDALDPNGHIHGLTSLGRVTARGGDLYIGAPIGRPRVEFNAHRVLDPLLVPALLPEFELVAFAYVQDGEVRDDRQPGEAVPLEYACGLYHLRRR
jgi:hypothetical protein